MVPGETSFNLVNCDEIRSRNNSVGVCSTAPFWINGC